MLSAGAPPHHLPSPQNIHDCLGTSVMYITDKHLHPGVRWAGFSLKTPCPMPASFINDPEHWRHRAEEIRTLADGMKDEISKQMMLRIAQDYERLAQRAEERAKRSS